MGAGWFGGRYFARDSKAFDPRLLFAKELSTKWTEDCPFGTLCGIKFSVRLRLPPPLHHRHPFRRANRFPLGASVAKGGFGNGVRGYHFAMGNDVIRLLSRSGRLLQFLLLLRRGGLLLDSKSVRVDFRERPLHKRCSLLLNQRYWRER